MLTIEYRGYTIFMDEEDYPLFLKYKWQVHTSKKSRTQYLQRCVNGTTSKFHREITNCPKELEVDHVDGNGLNNTKVNLEKVTHLANSRNCKLSANNKSGIQGVSWLADRKRWFAQIKVNRRTINLGRFKNLKDACDARQKAEQLYGFHTLHGRKC